jgi:hypothetical protein
VGDKRRVTATQTCLLGTLERQTDIIRVVSDDERYLLWWRGWWAEMSGFGGRL